MTLAVNDNTGVGDRALFSQHILSEGTAKSCQQSYYRSKLQKIRKFGASYTLIFPFHFATKKNNLEFLFRQQIEISPSKQK